MSVLDSKRSRASWIVLLLGIGLVVALWPYASGLLGAPVLYSITAPLHRWSSSDRASSRPPKLRLPA